MTKADSSKLHIQKLKEKKEAGGAKKHLRT